MSILGLCLPYDRPRLVDNALACFHGAGPFQQKEETARARQTKSHRNMSMNEK